MAGGGAGFGITTVSVALMEYTNDADRGSDASSLQLADSSGSAVTAAFSGALVALAAQGRISYGGGFAVVFVTMAALAVVATVRAGRLRPATGRPATGDRPSAGVRVPTEAASGPVS